MKIAIASFFLFCACHVAFSQSMSEPAPAQQNEAVDPPFRLTLAAYQSNPNVENTADFVMKSGTGVGFRIRKTNISNYEIPKWTELGFQFDVRDSDGNPVERIKQTINRSGGEDIIVGEPGIAPGEDRIILQSLLRYYRIDRPGTYTIQVSEHVSADPKSDVVKSNKIKITVLPKDPPVEEPK